MPFASMIFMIRQFPSVVPLWRGNFGFFFLLLNNPEMSLNITFIWCWVSSCCAFVVSRVWLVWRRRHPHNRRNHSAIDKCRHFMLNISKTFFLHPTMKKIFAEILSSGRRRCRLHETEWRRYLNPEFLYAAGSSFFLCSERQRVRASEAGRTNIKM